MEQKMNANTSTSNPSRPVEADDPLRYAFVEMLFALAVSQVAIHVADLTTVANPWVDRLPAVSHLCLALGVIAASWVGWRQSQSPGMKQQIQSIFSRRFLALLLDVLLVICYFVLVRGVELLQKDGVAVLTQASAVPEAFWLVVVFSIYVVWDWLADVFSPQCLNATGFWKRSWQGLRVAIVCSAASSICALLGLSVFYLAGIANGSLATVFFDGALLSVVLLFRVLKIFEKPLAQLFDVAGCAAFTSPRASTGKEKSLVLLFLMTYGALLWAAQLFFR
jgi:hypothetical protein